MLLADLRPRFWLEYGEPGERVGAGAAYSQGVSFDCPCEKCQDAPDGNPFRIVVAFDPPIQTMRGRKLEVSTAVRAWKRTGDSVSTLTLTPSIDASASGHWRGWLLGGEIR